MHFSTDTGCHHISHTLPDTVVRHSPDNVKFPDSSRHSAC